MHQRASNVYKSVDLESAPKEQIVARLIERLVVDLAVAKTAIGARDIQGKAAALSHAQRILVELQASLDHAQAPEMCANLERLYDYVNTQINKAHITLTAQPLDDASRVMTEVGDAFRQVAGR